MKRAHLIELEQILTAEVVKRRQLGGYSTDAAGLLLIAESIMRVVQHLVDNYSLMVELADATADEPAPRKKKAAKKTAK